MHGHQLAAPVCVEPGPAVGNHGCRQDIEREPAHRVAHRRLANTGYALPRADLEEHADPDPATGRTVVHQHREADSRGLDTHAGLLRRLSDQRGDDVFVRAVVVSGRAVPESRRVDVSGSAGHQDLRARCAVTAQDQVNVDRLLVPLPLPAHDAVPGLRASRTVNTASSRSIPPWAYASGN